MGQQNVSPLGHTSTSAPKHEWKHSVWVDGTMVPPDAASTSVMSHGLHYGTGVFEGIRVYFGRPFKLRDHCLRLLKSAELLGISISYDLASLISAAESVVNDSGLEHGYIRMVVWLGDEQLGLLASGLTSHVAVMIWEWPKIYTDENIGVSVMLSDARRPSPSTLPPQSKATGGYLTGFHAFNTARQAGFQDCLFLDFEGFVAEGTSANIFFVKNNTLLTPKADRFLNGITRQTIIQCACDAGIEVVEDRIQLNQIATFDEAFFTGTAVEVAPVTTLGTTEFPIGPVTKSLRSAYAALTGPAANNSAC